MDDREWMYTGRPSPYSMTYEWIRKTDAFLNQAFAKGKGMSRIFCPCGRCENRKRQTKEIMGRHLVKNGFMENYTRWTHHGEPVDRVRGEVVRQRIEACDADAGTIMKHTSIKDVGRRSQSQLQRPTTDRCTLGDACPPGSSGGGRSDQRYPQPMWDHGQGLARAHVLMAPARSETPVESVLASRAPIATGVMTVQRNAAPITETMPEAEMNRAPRLVAEIEDAPLPLPDGSAQHEAGQEAEGTVESEAVQEIDKPDDFPKRRRRRAVPEDTSLLRRSSRIEANNKGFKPKSGTTSKTTASSSSAAPTTSKKTKAKGKMNAAGPLVIYEGHSTLGAAPSPHLSLGNAQAIGAGFSKMHPEAVSEKSLMNHDDVSTTD